MKQQADQTDLADVLEGVDVLADLVARRWGSADAAAQRAVTDALISALRALLPSRRPALRILPGGRAE